MSISNIIDDLRNGGIIPNNRPTNLSFGTKEQCKASFIEIFQAVDKTVTKFVYHKEYDQIIDWLTDNKGKGLALMGSVGVGKSVIIRSVIPVYMRAQYNKNVRVFGLTDFLTMDGKDFRSYLRRSIIAIDELGREPLMSDYGVKFEAVPVLVESCEVESKLLFISSNARKEDICRRYGLHTFDRIQKLCRIITITGKSNR
jgi:DNA replication protein DnaC